MTKGEFFERAMLAAIEGLSVPTASEWLLPHDVAENAYSTASEAVRVFENNGHRFTQIV